ncbi:hypothetical protein DPMN_080165 [Dreissena polymorpha]|uniref:Uncharacterized protein n=1 Tax=Dreissena polymorpha TaxID=45954 RepID=A0A9D3YTY8_DREPO|nr:hypothetical protein DPMN_080165 [Dreissena polymorpha]
MYLVSAVREAFNEDDWEPVYRIYENHEWDSHDDYLSQERSARFGDKDDSQFRSWKLDQWHHDKIHKVGSLRKMMSPGTIKRIYRFQLC